MIVSPFSVYILILNWNLSADTIACVESVLASSYPHIHVLVIDNGSTDASPKILGAHFGRKIELLVLPHNLGFGQGHNHGIRLALARGAQYTLLLNNDTFIHPDMIAELVSCAESDPDIGILSPLIYAADQPGRVWYSGMRVRLPLYAWQRPIHRRPDLERIERVDFVSGCGILVRSVVWQRAGLFSPHYFMYYEDFDLCLAARRAGFHIAVATQAAMWHHIARSSGGAQSADRQYHQVKSTLTFYRQHAPGAWFWINTGLTLVYGLWSFATQGLLGRLSLDQLRWYWRGVKEGFHPQKLDF